MVLFFFEEKAERPMRSALGSAQKANNVNGTLPFRAAAELAREVKARGAGRQRRKNAFSLLFFPCVSSAFVIYCTYITYIHCGFAGAAASAETP